MSKPLCLKCGASDRTEFPLFPKTKYASGHGVFKFGEICVECDEKVTCDHGETKPHYITIQGARGLWPTYTQAYCPGKREQ